MRVLLAVLNHVETAHPVLAAAGMVAQRLPQARIDVLQLRLAADPTFLPTEEIMTSERQAHFEAKAAALSADLREVFNAWRHEFWQAIDVTWREERGEQAAIIARDGSRVDLIVIGRAAHYRPGDGKAAITAALFDASAPVLLVPEAVPATVGRHIAVAWKPSDTAERAVVAALPLLHVADRVTVLTGAEGNAEKPPPPDELVRLMAERNLVPAMHPFALGDQSVGSALLRAAHSVGADMLVMGAYAHRRTIEALLGGATHDVLAEADLPVFMHH